LVDLVIGKLDWVIGKLDWVIGIVQSAINQPIDIQPIYQFTNF
jgi:hypothetical protein